MMLPAARFMKQCGIIEWYNNASHPENKTP
jgi:hypothetical protein